MRLIVTRKTAFHKLTRRHRINGFTDPGFLRTAPLLAVLVCNDTCRLEDFSAIKETADMVTRLLRSGGHFSRSPDVPWKRQQSVSISTSASCFPSCQSNWPSQRPKREEGRFVLRGMYQIPTCSFRLVLFESRSRRIQSANITVTRAINRRFGRLKSTFQTSGLSAYIPRMSMKWSVEKLATANTLNYI